MELMAAFSPMDILDKVCVHYKEHFLHDRESSCGIWLMGPAASPLQLFALQVEVTCHYT